MKFIWFLLIACWSLSAKAGTPPSNRGDEVVVVFNKNLSDSKSVAEYYAQRRQIPKGQVWGLDLPTTETMSRNEFEHDLAGPLLKKLRDAQLLVYNSAGKGRSNSKVTNDFPVLARVRYAVLCYGVPLKILNDPKRHEPAAETVRPELRRNDAAVDSELALLPVLAPKPPLFGALPNRVYTATNSAQLSPTNGILLVTRLDGPSPAIARGLVDKAIQAETDGLWGRAYFDSRGITNGTYKIGDDWMRGGAQISTGLGFETVLDKEPATFAVSFPMSQIALYAGWYDGTVSGPFTRPTVEFMPGAFAYHLHSYSAQTIRSPTANWVGPFLAKGATITMGCVEEPYLEATPDVLAFIARFVYFGLSFGEAAYACQNSVSWQTTVVGDPLYRPFSRKPQEQHDDLARRKSNLIEWSHLRLVDMNLAAGKPSDKFIEYLETIPETPTSPVLLEKLADLYFLKAKMREAILNYRRAMDRVTSPQQHIRLYLSLARALDFDRQDEELFGVYQQFVKQFPDYPDLLAIYRRLSALAEQQGKPQVKELYQREIERLTAPTPATNP